ncbi:MAG: ATPase [Pseudonocardia sp.]|nr:ATPase [Pseudonocardia sp.]
MFGVPPTEATSFVGRKRELTQARRLLSDSRLLTLTGAGGVGKTRLAMQVAEQLRPAFPDGIYIAELDALRDPGLLAHTVATVLGLGDTGVEPITRLREYLEDKRLLLVLDNCEHLVDDCAMLASRLLSRAPELRVLTTSRHVLGIEGEHIMEVPPLPVPDDEASGSDAVSLFCDRAAAAAPGFDLDDGNREQVGAICRRLDGMPLALELAAAWVGTLSPGGILDRLDDRFRLLTGGYRNAPSRQQTLSAAIGWSYHLCSPREQRLWSRLSVFAGGFDVEAVEDVCAGAGLERAQMLHLIAGLVEKSVVIRQPDTHDAGARYRMLETIREYGRALLVASGQQNMIRTRHAEHFRAVARRYQAESFGPRQLEWVQRMLREHPNIRAALEFGLSGSGQARTAMETAAALWNSWWGGAFGREGYRWLARALGMDPEPTRVRGHALSTCAHFAVHLGEVDTARRMLAECAALVERLDDPVLRAGHAEHAGHAAMHRGEFEDACVLLERAAALYHELGDPGGVADSLILLAASALFLDDRRGVEAAKQALRLCREHDATWTKSYALRAVALNEWHAGDHREGARLVQDAIRLQRAIRDWTGLAYMLEVLAWCSSSAGHHGRVARLLGAAALSWRLSGATTVTTECYKGTNKRVAEQARDELGEDRFRTEFDQGFGLTADEMFAEALEEQTPDTPRRGTELTRREAQVAGLVAEGLSNKKIAARLAIAQRTVENHVERILSKLGFTSRAQIATWVADNQDRALAATPARSGQRSSH